VENLYREKSCFSMPLDRLVSGFFRLKKIVLRLFGSLGSCWLFHVGVVGLVLVTAYMGRRRIFAIFGGKSAWQR
jgi:hypothetical protein